jgi:hypothetical protein
MYILGICHVYTRYFCYEVLKEDYAFLNSSGFNTRLFSIMAWVYSIGIQTNSRKLNFYIQGIYMIYTGSWYIHSMVYTWYIPCIIFIGWRFQMEALPSRCCCVACSLTIEETSDRHDTASKE